MQSFVIAIVVYAILCLAPVATFIFLGAKYAKLELEESISTFGSLYEGLRNK
jgi:hypothetical protein